MSNSSRGVQLGETIMILTGGMLRATPHYVRGITNKDYIMRSTMASFFEPSFD